MIGLSKEFVGVVESGLRSMPDSEYILLKYAIILGVAIISSGLTTVTLDGIRKGRTLISDH